MVVAKKISATCSKVRKATPVLTVEDVDLPGKSPNESFAFAPGSKKARGPIAFPAPVRLKSEPPEARLRPDAVARNSLVKALGNERGVPCISSSSISIVSLMPPI